MQGEGEVNGEGEVQSAGEVQGAGVAAGRGHGDARRTALCCLRTKRSGESTSMPTSRCSKSRRAGRPRLCIAHSHSAVPRGRRGFEAWLGGVGVEAWAWRRGRGGVGVEAWGGGVGWPRRAHLAHRARSGTPSRRTLSALRESP